MSEANHVFKSQNNDGWSLEVEPTVDDDGDVALIMPNPNHIDSSVVYLSREQRMELAGLLELI